MLKSKVILLTAITTLIMTLSVVATPFYVAADNVNSARKNDSELPKQSVDVNLPPDMRQGSENTVISNAEPPQMHWQKSEFIHSLCKKTDFYNEDCCGVLYKHFYVRSVSAECEFEVMLC